MQAHSFTRLTRSLITLLSAVHPPTYFLSLEGGYSTTLPLHAHCAHSMLFRRHTTSVCTLSASALELHVNLLVLCAMVLI
jgi:hypothetical protein